MKRTSHTYTDRRGNVFTDEVETYPASEREAAFASRGLCPGEHTRRTFFFDIINPRDWEDKTFCPIAKTVALKAGVKPDEGFYSLIHVTEQEWGRRVQLWNSPCC